MPVDPSVKLYNNKLEDRSKHSKSGKLRSESVYNKVFSERSRFEMKFSDIYKVIKESIKNSKKIEQKVSKNNIEHILLLNKNAKDFATTIIEEVL